MSGWCTQQADSARQEGPTPPEILTYTPDMAGDVAAVYNNAIARVPHCYPVSPEQMAAVLAGAVDRSMGHESLEDEGVLVARAGGQVVGYVHMGVALKEKAEDGRQGVIRFLAQRRGHRAAGQALLHAAERYLREREMRQVTAFDYQFRYPFYHFKAGYLSDRMDHVQALLGLKGYEKVKGEVFLDWPHFEPLEPEMPEMPVDVTVRWVEGNGTRPNLVVMAEHDEIKTGECWCVSGGEYSQAEDAQDWTFTTWLGVAARVRGQHLGLYMLRRALKEAHAAGYKHAAISTAWDNYRAQLFYANCGYEATDWTYAWRRVQP